MTRISERYLIYFIAGFIALWIWPFSISKLGFYFIIIVPFLCFLPASVIHFLVMSDTDKKLNYDRYIKEFGIDYCGPLCLGLALLIPYEIPSGMGNGMMAGLACLILSTFFVWLSERTSSHLQSFLVREGFPIDKKAFETARSIGSFRLKLAGAGLFFLSMPPWQLISGRHELWQTTWEMAWIFAGLLSFLVGLNRLSLKNSVIVSGILTLLTLALPSHPFDQAIVIASILPLTGVLHRYLNELGKRVSHAFTYLYILNILLLWKTGFYQVNIEDITLILIGLAGVLLYVGLGLGIHDDKPRLGQSFAAGFFLGTMAIFSAVTLMDSSWVNNRLVDEMNHVIQMGRSSVFGTDWSIILTSERYQAILWLGTIPLPVLCGCFLTVIEWSKRRNINQQSESPIFLWAILFASGSIWLTSLNVTSILTNQMNQTEIMGGTGPALPFMMINHLYCDVPLIFFVVCFARLSIRRMSLNRGFQWSDWALILYAFRESFLTISNIVFDSELSLIPILCGFTYAFCIWNRDKSLKLEDIVSYDWAPLLQRSFIFFTFLGLASTTIGMTTVLGESHLDSNVVIQSSILFNMTNKSNFSVVEPGSFNSTLLLNEINFTDMGFIATPWNSIIAWSMIGLFTSWLGGCGLKYLHLLSYYVFGFVWLSSPANQRPVLAS